MQMKPVDMVNNFCAKKIAANLLLNNKPMLKHQACRSTIWVVIRSGNKGVPIKINYPASAKAVV